MTPEYLAGIIDGEGCLVLRIQDGTRSLQCRIEVTNTHRGLIEAIQREWGGRIYEKAPGGKQKLMAWCIRISGPEADRVAAAITPYVIVKKNQLAIWLRARKMCSSRGGYRTVRLTEGDHARRSAVVAEMRSLRLREGVRA